MAPLMTPPYIVAFVLVMLGAASSLFLPYARLGDLTWTLTQKCIVCEITTPFFAPMQAFTTATNVAFYCVVLAISLALVAGILISFMDSNPDAAGLVLCLASGFLVLAPIAFVVLLPAVPSAPLRQNDDQSSPVSLAYGALLGALCGVVALLLVGLHINATARRKPAEPVALHERRAPASGPVGSYGALI